MILRAPKIHVFFCFRFNKNFGTRWKLRNQRGKKSSSTRNQPISETNRTDTKEFYELNSSRLLEATLPVKIPRWRSPESPGEETTEMDRMTKLNGGWRKLLVVFPEHEFGVCLFFWVMADLATWKVVTAVYIVVFFVVFFHQKLNGTLPMDFQVSC